jgi:hypothetical protein
MKALTQGSLAIVVGSHAFMLLADHEMSETERRIHAWANLIVGGFLALDAWACASGTSFWLGALRGRAA